LSEQQEVIVIGGGLAGLTAAATAARSGTDVTVLEARESLGGRARTRDIDGARFNEGAHALYANLSGAAVLADLGIVPRGGKPGTRFYGRLRGRIGRLPGTPLDGLRPTLLGLKAKTQLGMLMASPRRMLNDDYAGLSMADVIDKKVSDPDARRFLTTFGRVSTYVDDMSQVSADAAVRQLVSSATDGVWYLDGGWKQLVDGLLDVCRAAGVTITTGVKVTGVNPADREGERVEVISDGETLTADSVIIGAGGPKHVAQMLDSAGASASAAEWDRDLRPVYASCLDMHLERLPVPKQLAVFSLDDPIYLSTHSGICNMTDSGELVHAMWYGDPGHDPRGALETFLDDAQPGWRDVVINERYGRSLLVTYGRPEPSTGFAGRPGPVVPDAPGVFVAGDWVGDTGMLADAALASGAEAGRLSARQADRALA
jgi:phytoene dehydrogenase-like protein